MPHLRFGLVPILMLDGAAGGIVGRAGGESVGDGGLECVGRRNPVEGAFET